MPTIRHLTDLDYAETVLAHERALLVDLWAPWCDTCTQAGPALREIARTHATEMDVVRANVDDNPGVVNLHGHLDLPARLLVVNGDIVERIGPEESEATLRERLRTVLSTTAREGRP